MRIFSLKKTLRTQEEKEAFLIVAGGLEIQKALVGKPVAGEITDADPIPVFDNAMLRLDHHFKTGTNAITHIIRFKAIKQKKGERFIEFVQRLQENASYCGFGTVEEVEIMLQIRTGAIHAAKLSEMMTRENKSLIEFINYGSSLDAEQAVEPERKISTQGEDEVDVSAVSSRQSNYNPGRFSQAGRYNQVNRFKPSHDYRRDGGGRQQDFYRSRGGGQGQQPRVCFNCRRPGHYARDCRSRPNTSNQRQNDVAYTEAGTNEDNKRNVRFYE